MQKKQSESPASDNGKNVHYGPTFLQIIMLWKKYNTINVHAYITLKHTLILKNIKHVKVLETTQKPAETDRESSLGRNTLLDEFPVFTALCLRTVPNWYSIGVFRTQKEIPSLTGFGNQQREAGYYSSWKVKGN